MCYMTWLCVDASSLQPPCYRTGSESVQRTGGDPSAAADLYGIGVRIGIYLQSIGMLVSLFQELGKGYKLAISSNANGLLLAWTILMQRNAFSFCESYLILIEVSCFLLPGSIIIVDFQTAANEIVGLIGLLLALCWLNAGALWLFTTHYSQLPQLGTSNVGWMFARVRLDGWYRIFLIVFWSTTCFVLAIVIILVFFLLKFVLRNADDERLVEIAFMRRFSREDSWQNQAIKKNLKNLRRVGALVGLIYWIFSVAACEMTIIWNDLSPETSLTRPGQTIPLIIGIIIAADGFSSIMKHMVFRT